MSLMTILIQWYAPTWEQGGFCNQSEEQFASWFINIDASGKVLPTQVKTKQTIIHEETDSTGGLKPIEFILQPNPISS